MAAQCTGHLWERAAGDLGKEQWVQGHKGVGGRGEGEVREAVWEGDVRESQGGAVREEQ